MAAQPNILLVTCHDLGQHLGCYGVPTVDTPTLDRLAAEGVRFSRSFCVAPQCSPSRATLFSGRFPHANGVMGLCHAGFKWDYNEGEVHLARRLADAGYHTACLGIVHESPSQEGLGFAEIMPHRPPCDDETTPFAINLAENAERWLADIARREQPFYLQLGFFEPHRNHGYPTQWPPTNRPARADVTVPGYLADTPGAREEMAWFEASVRTVDDAMIRVLGALEAAGLAEDTLVIFTADHGIPFPRAKCTLYDPGLEVPLIMRWPRGPWQAGTVHDAMVSNTDYVPTLCDLLGLPAPENTHGISFAPLLKGEPLQPRREIFAEMTYHDYYDPIRCLRTETHKLIVSFCYNKALMDCSQQWGRRTTTVVPPDPHAARHPLVELYDVAADPLEHENLAERPEMADLRRELLARLHAWMVDTGDPLLEGVPMSPTHHEALAVLNDAAGR